jgi:hypothetical protein
MLTVSLLYSQQPRGVRDVHPDAYQTTGHSQHGCSLRPPPPTQRTHGSTGACSSSVPSQLWQPSLPVAREGSALSVQRSVTCRR